MHSTHRPSITTRRALRKLGEDIRNARRRRQLTMAILAERALTTRQTLQKVEAGDPTVAMGIYATVLQELGLLNGLGELAAFSHDEVGLSLSDENLPKRVRLRSREPSPELGLPMSDQPSFPGFEPPPSSRLTDRLFLGVFLHPDAAERAASLSHSLRKELSLRGRPLPPERLHFTLHHIDDYAGLPPRVVAAICDAAATVRMGPFEVEFDRVASFTGRPGNLPLVLRGGDGLAELMKFHRGLGAAITRARVGRPVASQFTPHVTLLYDHIQVEERAVEPIRWTVSEFILVHSLLGQTRHVPLARWSLSD
ncbi:MAG TPA: 2'-5' RNA ligase family protein [Caulobacteraceae bacterium]